ncbi:MAG: DegT/DnrJ/EryC1/StrS aminotransferase family protein [Pseudomonadota bacterium]
MERVRALADIHDLRIIEDSCHSPGGFFTDSKGKQQSCGNGAYADLAIFSFHPVKHIATGEGGMVTTNDEALWRTMWARKDHGKNYAAVHEREHPPGFRWLHEDFGTNARMTEMQAAIGRIQLQRMPEWTRCRTTHAAALTHALTPYAGHNGCIRLTPFHCHHDSPAYTQDNVHAYYKYYCFVRPENLAPDWNRDRVIDAINAAGVPCYVGSCSEVYLEKAFDDTSYRPAQRLPNARTLGDTSLMFLVHPTLTSAEINKTTHVITSVLQQASSAVTSA